VPLYALDRDFFVHITAATPDALSLRFDGAGLGVSATLPVLGPHLAANAALAAACVQHSGLVPAAALAAAVARGLASASLPGRTEILSRRPWVVADGAHTEASAAALMRALDGLACCERHMMVSMSAGKDVARVLSILLPGAASVTLTRADPARSADPARLAAIAAEHCPPERLRIVDDPNTAITDTLAALSPDALMCVTGSVYIAGAARTALIG
jgi:dihydrofolate synthase/folylpolyglutamate synthase